MARSLVWRCLLVCALALRAGSASPAWSQTPDGGRVFQASCATCHSGAADSRAPGLDSLRVRTPQAIIDSLLTGAMRPQGARLSGPERRAVAEFITGKPVDGDVTGARALQCQRTARGSLEVSALDGLEPVAHERAWYGVRQLRIRGVRRETR